MSRNDPRIISERKQARDDGFFNGRKAATRQVGASDPTLEQGISCDQQTAAFEPETH